MNRTRGDVVVLVGPEVILQIKAGSGTLDVVGDVIEERNTRDWVIKDVAVCPGRGHKSLVMPSGSLFLLFSFCANFVFVSSCSGFVKWNRHQVRKENEKRQKWHVGAPEWVSCWGCISSNGCGETVGTNATVMIEKSRINRERVFLLASLNQLGGGARDSYRGGWGVRLCIGLDVWRSILVYIFVSLYLKWRQTFPARSKQSMFVASTSKTASCKNTPHRSSCPYSNPFLRAQPPVPSPPQLNPTFLFRIAPGKHLKSA